MFSEGDHDLFTASRDSILLAHSPQYFKLTSGWFCISFIG
ncbi:hypothetical protein MNBD_GAMMA18-1696 [hydrothermal vent metagenome]|uniref:Uncharacterized protein n=1 Tax=hydrothermal vent metagenome TaxID=652676 RepID=A0A3B0ZMQ6_9ZZZZ